VLTFKLKKYQQKVFAQHLQPERAIKKLFVPFWQFT